MSPYQVRDGAALYGDSLEESSRVAQSERRIGSMSRAASQSQASLSQLHSFSAKGGTISPPITSRANLALQQTSRVLRFGESVKKQDSPDQQATAPLQRTSTVRFSAADSRVNSSARQLNLEKAVEVASFHEGMRVSSSSSVVAVASRKASESGGTKG